jgi:hypothetical protein
VHRYPNARPIRDFASTIATEIPGKGKEKDQCAAIRLIDWFATVVASRSNGTQGKRHGR